MSRGFSEDILQRLWNLTEFLSKEPATLDEISNGMPLSERLCRDSIKRIRELGIPLLLDHKTKKYQIYWPDESQSLKLQPEHLFSVFYFSSIFEDNELQSRISLAINPVTLDLHDSGPAYGIDSKIQKSKLEIFELISNAIISFQEIVVSYDSLENNLLLLRPMRLVRTPISWSLLAYCTDENDYKIFKVSKIQSIKLTNNHFEPILFNPREFFKDAWWTQSGDKKYYIEVLFTGEAAQTIQEYKFHDSQKYNVISEGTIVKWKLSYLGEFTSWLMQWLGQFKVIKPLELKDEINQRIKLFKKLN